MEHSHVLLGEFDHCLRGPLRYAGGIVPAGLEKLYLIGMSAPRGPQIPIYGVQTKIAVRMIALHEAAGEGGAGIQTYLSALQEPDDRIDIVRVVWEEQLADAHRLLDACPQAQKLKDLARAGA
jgi:hypothetical protein